LDDDGDEPIASEFEVEFHGIANLRPMEIT